MLSRNFLRGLLMPALAASSAALAGPLYNITALPPGTNPTGINSSGQIVGDVGVDGGARRAFVWSAGSMVTYGTLGGADSTGAAINNSGRIAGSAANADGSTHAVTGMSGSLSKLNVYGGAVSSFGRAINGAGQVAGYYYPGAGGVRAFTQVGGVDIDLGTLGGNFATASGINSAGHIVGFSALDDSSPWLAHAFLYADGVMHDLGTMEGASLSEATAINDNGQVAGHGWVFGSHHAFLWQDGVMQDLGTLGGRRSFAYGMNNLGQVVGNSNDIEDFDYFAYLYSGGVMTDLNALIDPASGWVLHSANGINDAGQIAAYGCRGDECGALLLDLTPAAVPEPGSLGLFAAALMLLGWGRTSPLTRAAYRRA